MDELVLEEPLQNQEVLLPEPVSKEECAPLAKKPRRIRPVVMDPVKLKEVSCK